MGKLTNKQIFVIALIASISILGLGLAFQLHNVWLSAVIFFSAFWSFLGTLKEYLGGEKTIGLGLAIIENDNSKKTKYYVYTHLVIVTAIMLFSLFMLFG